MASMDPTDEDLENWKTIGDLIPWVGLKGSMTEDGSEVKTLLTVLGAEPDTQIRVIGSMTKEDYTAVINADAWQPLGRPPTPTARSKAALLGRAARIACGMELTNEMQELADKASREHELAVLKLQSEMNPLSIPTLPTNPTSGGAPNGLLALPPPDITKKVKMNLVADQVYDQEIPVLSDTDISTLYKNYTDVFGDMPPPEEEITVEQLTALDALVKSGAPPYVDFAVWGPHGYRLMRKLRMTGMQLMPGGDFRQVELAGPPTFGMWQRCYMCLKTGLLMLKAVSIAKLLKYHEQQKRYHERYGPAVWHLQYQTEVHMRQERMVHIKRLGIEEHRRATAAHGTSDYNPDMPWDYVWGRATEDFSWWRQEFEEPCLLIITRTRSLNAMVDGDVDISATPEAKRRKSGPQQVQGSSWESGYGSNESPLKHGKMERLHNVVNGAFTTNRRGTALCEDFNAGNCTETIGQNRCQKDPSKLHQCSKCLSVDHPASQCSKVPGPPPAQPAAVANRFKGGPIGGYGNKGKSKGKGQFKGKGKGRYFG